MKYEYLPEEIRNIVLSPFAFISYCHDNSEIVERVQKLVAYLKSKDIPVVYDGGGLQPGAEITQFENLIYDDNCKKVLVICDKCYEKKIDECSGGVWQEYIKINNDYQKNRLKYIPLKVDAMLSLFSGKRSILFDHSFENSFDEIENALREIKRKDKCYFNWEHFGKRYKKADDKYVEGDFEAALENVKEIIDECSDVRNVPNEYIAKVYKLYLLCFLALSQMEDFCYALKIADNLYKLISKDKSLPKLEIYYCNCTLVYRIQNKKSRKYLECAELSYEYAKENKRNDMSYFSCLYATALYDTNQFSKAYKLIKIALDYFYKENPELNLSEDKKRLYIQIQGNIADIANMYSKNPKNSRKKRLSLLLEAQKGIIDLLDIGDIDDETMLYEIYSIAINVFSALKEYYGNINKIQV